MPYPKKTDQYDTSEQDNTSLEPTPAKSSLSPKEKLKQKLDAMSPSRRKAVLKRASELWQQKMRQESRPTSSNE